MEEPRKSEQEALPQAYEILSDPEQRRLLYVAIRNLVEKVVEEDYDALVFLDKSARPLAHLYRNVLADTHPDTQKKPSISFLHIGREIELFDEELNEGDSDESVTFSVPYGIFADRNFSIPNEELERVRAKYRNLSALPEWSRVLVVDDIHTYS